MAGHGLSKSHIVAWKQCPKRLWLQIHRRDLFDVLSVTPDPLVLKEATHIVQVNAPAWHVIIRSSA